MVQPAQAISIMAPKDELAESAAVRNEDVANNIFATVYGEGHANKTMGPTCLTYKDGNRTIVIP